MSGGGVSTQYRRLHHGFVSYPLPIQVLLAHCTPWWFRASLGFGLVCGAGLSGCGLFSGLTIGRFSEQWRCCADSSLPNRPPPWRATRRLSPQRAPASAAGLTFGPAKDFSKFDSKFACARYARAARKNFREICLSLSFYSRNIYLYGPVRAPPDPLPLAGATHAADMALLLALRVAGTIQTITKSSRH